MEGKYNEKIGIGTFLSNLDKEESTRLTKRTIVVLATEGLVLYNTNSDESWSIYKEAVRKYQQIVELTQQLKKLDRLTDADSVLPKKVNDFMREIEDHLSHKDWRFVTMLKEVKKEKNTNYKHS